MFSYCGRDFQVLFDLTGDDHWQKNEYLFNNIERLAQKKHVVCVGKVPLEKISRMHEYYRLATVDHMKQVINDVLGKNEIGLLIISNNVDHIQEWVESGFSTVLLSEDLAYSQLHCMPDEIWNNNHFAKFAGDPTYRKKQYRENTGFLKAERSESNLPRYLYFLDIPYSSNKADVIFTGRYFTWKDNRNYSHPLSRAILGFKNNYGSNPKAVKRMLGEMIDSVVSSDVTVRHITFVPPRPSERSRFLGMEEYIRSEQVLEYDLLRATSNYQSPKKYHEYDKKYQCVQGNIECVRDVSGTVLLIDDIFTSGATTAECAKVLYESGASNVVVMPLAFTQRRDIRDQRLMPVVFNSDGNEFSIKFTKKDSKAFYSSKDNAGKYDSRDFDVVFEEYLKYDRYGSPQADQTSSLPDEKEVKAIIFDLDNTLLRTDHLEGYRTGNLNVKNITRCNGEHVIIDPDLLVQLKRANIDIGIVTKSPKYYASELLALYGYPYDYLVASRDTLRSKPFPDPLLKCALKLKVDPQHVLNVGDQYSDMRAGEGAGMINMNVENVLGSNVLERIIERS